MTALATYLTLSSHLYNVQYVNDIILSSLELVYTVLEIAIAIYVENGAVGGKLSYIAMDIMDTYFSQTGKYETVYGENEIR